jgi:putative transposase
VRYVGLNPVRARFVEQARDWPWSSVRAHLAGVDDELAIVAPVLERTDSFAAPMANDRDDGYEALRRSEATGRPVGDPEFVAGLEALLGRPIARRAPGRKKHGASPDQLQLV